MEKCSSQRSKEVAAIKDLSVDIMEEMSRRMDLLVNNIDMKVYEKCGSKFDGAEYRIMKVLRDELSFLATPSAFNHPEGVDRIDSGAQVFLNSLHNVNLKRREQEIDLAKSKNDYLIQSKLNAPRGLAIPLTPQTRSYEAKATTEVTPSQSIRVPVAISASESSANLAPATIPNFAQKPSVIIPASDFDNLSAQRASTAATVDIHMEKIEDAQVFTLMPDLPAKMPEKTSEIKL